MSGWVWLGVAIVGAVVFLYGLLTIATRAGEVETLADLGEPDNLRHLTSDERYGDRIADDSNETEHQ